MLVAVGTNNPNKVRAVVDAYAMFGFRATAVAVGAPPTLPGQPIGVGNVFGGALARANHALSAVAGAEHGVGLEAGVVEVGGKHLDVTIAVIGDRNGEVTVGVGPGFQIPNVFLGQVLGGRELGAVADEFLGRRAVGRREGLVGVLTRGRVGRYDLNLAAVAMALVPRLPYNRGLYWRG